jgi:PKD repeat protein
VTFDASNSTDAWGIISYDWNFGDGTNGTGKTVTHPYSASGTYLATLSVHDAAGNTAMSTVTVTVRANMLPEFPQEFFAIPFMGLVTLVFLIVRKKASNLSREKSH